MDHSSRSKTLDIMPGTTRTKEAAAAKKYVEDAKAKPASPKKARLAPNMREKLKQKNQKAEHTIRVHGFMEPFTIEAYEYTVTDIKPGFVDKYRKWSKGELVVDSLTDANFVGLKMQRDVTDAGNESLKSFDGYSWVWMIRYPPENESNEITRREGLRVMKEFFMSKIATAYPPSLIRVVDETTDVPAILEDFFLDADIEEIVKASFDMEELDEDFFTNYTTLSKTIYLNKEPSSFAHHQLGFPTLD
jgi:hypothetical protein